MGVFKWLDGWTLGVPHFQHAGILGSAIVNPSIPALGLYWASVTLVRWAFAPNSPRIAHGRIDRERREEQFEPDAKHIVICGPSGSGKSSILNALMGKRNEAPKTAPTGTLESTKASAKYKAHSNLGQVVLHDCPGAGTQRVLAKNC